MASIREAVKRLEQLNLVEVRHGDAMRVSDWRTSGGLDVAAHLLFAAGGVDRPTLAALLEARRLMLTEAARLAAERRTEEQAGQLEELASRMAESPDVQLVDLAFMTALVEASGNVVFVLILNTVRRIYLENADRLEAVAAPRPRAAVRAGREGDRRRGGDPGGQRDREARRGAGAAARWHERAHPARGVDLRVHHRHRGGARARAARRARNGCRGLPRPLAGRGAGAEPDRPARAALRGGARAPGAGRPRPAARAHGGRARRRRSSPPRRRGGPRCARW